jgi:hypothetical protein
VPQVKPHDVPSQVAVAFEGGVQAVHDVAPQLEVLPFETHAVPHRWKPDLQEGASQARESTLCVPHKYRGGVRQTHTVDCSVWRPN